MSGKGHRRRFCLIDAGVFASRWDKALPRKTKAQRAREDSKIVAGFADIFLLHDDPKHPAVVRYRKRYSYRKDLQKVFDSVVNLRQDLKNA